MQQIQYERYSSERYHNHPAIGSTQLKYAMKSLAKFKANMYKSIQKTSASMELGTCAHAAVLEKDFGRYIVGPDVAKSTKEWKTFAEGNPDKIVLKPDTYWAVKEMYDTFYGHEIAPKMLADGIAEATFIAPINAVFYKCRPDWLVIATESYIVDYKTCWSCEYEDFQKAILNYGYDVSAAHYMRVFQEATGRHIDEFYWIAQETEPPYEIRIYRMDEECRAQAVKTVNTLYHNIAWGIKKDVWPYRHSPEIFDIDLPTWAIDKGARNVEKLTDNPE